MASLATPSTTPSAGAESPPPPSSGAAETAEVAVAEAVRTGRRVEVMGKRTEYTQVFAEPTGRLRYEAAVVPQRVRRADGIWADIDLHLRRGPAGRVQPVASAADVRFSSGGTGPLVELVEDGKVLSLTWQGGLLPRPVLSGDQATYPEVVPGADLVLRATRTGFSHVLVVKTPQAATHPLVTRIGLDIGGDATVVEAPDGGLHAVAGRTVLASAQAPQMWDSRPAARSAVAEPSTPAAPGGGVRVADVGTEVTRTGDLVLHPDKTLLDPDTAAFPVFIDPAWSKTRSKWAYATNNNSNNTDLSVARVGDDPNSSIRYRSFFEFPTSDIKGKHIESAYVQMKLDHSWSCTGTWTNMWHSAAVTTPRTAWSTRLIKWVASATSHANEGSGCADSPQPDMVVNFVNNAVTALVQSTANGGYSTLTVGFCACDADGSDEGATDRWKKFFPGDAKLIADVDAKPGKPAGLQVSGIACTTSGITIGTLTPTLSATFPDADGSQAIRGTWEWLEVPAAGTWNDSTPRKTAPPQTSAAAGSRATTTMLSGLATGKRYAFRTRGTDPAPYDQTGPWSDWCVFAPDTSVPPVGVTVVSTPPGPGRPGTFRIDSTASDVTTFRYGWTEAVTTEVTPTTNGTGKTATATLTAPKYGTNILYVQAIDATGNRGYGSAEFTVDRPAPAIARWGMESYLGVSPDQALSDQQSALGGDTPLTGTLLEWRSDARLMGGRTATFNGGSSQAVAAGLTPDTTRTFSVAAWVRLRDTNGYQTFVSKDGAAGQWSPFRLQMVNNGTAPPRWCFTMSTSLTTGSAQFLCSSTTAVAGQWTHVAGSYDATDGRMRLWVDGQRIEMAAPSTPTTTNGPLVLGRAMNAGSASDRTYGSVADVQFFDRVLVDHDFTGQLAEDPESGGFDERGILAPIMVGRWDFDATLRCYEQPSVVNNCVAPADDWGRRLLFTMGSDTDGGRLGAGALLDDTHWAEPPDPFAGRATMEYASAQRNTAPDGQPQQWQDTPVLRTDQSFSISVWLRPDRAANPTMTAVGQKGTAQSRMFLGTRDITVGATKEHRWAFMTMSNDAIGTAATHAASSSMLTEDDTVSWTHLVGVFDAERKQVRLYVNGGLAGVGPDTSGWQADGPLTVGAALWSPPGEGPRMVDGWRGGLDDLRVYQGAMTDAQVLEIHEQQALPTL